MGYGQGRGEARKEERDEAPKQGHDVAREDGELAARAIAGDPAAFEEIVVRYHKAVYNLAFRATHNHEDARDLTQDIFLEAYRAVQGFRQDSRIVLYHYEGLSYREISDILRLPVRTVETRLYRAKKLLRSMLSRDDRM